MSRTILLADDSVTIQKVIELTFMEEDYDVLAVSDGDEALEKLGEVTPDIVIADVHMPGASGLDVCRRSKEIHPDVPVLLLVGTFEPFDEAESAAAGADAHLKKPFDSQELLQLVGELMAADGAADASTDASTGDDLDSDLGELDLSADAGADEAVAAAEAGTAADSDWGFGGPAALETEEADEPSAAGADSGAETVRTDFGDLSWGEGSQIEVEAPAAIGQQDEPAPVWGVVESAPEQADSAAPDETADDAPDAASDAADDAPAESDWGFQMAQSIETEDAELEEVAFDADADADADLDADLDDEAPAFAVSDDLDSYGSADIEAAAYGGSESSGTGSDADSGSDGVGSVGGLSDDDVDRIARRVSELLGERVAREVAWEVIPDLAEVVIRERLRELEGQLD